MVNSLSITGIMSSSSNKSRKRLKFKVPRVVQTVDLELEEDLLAGVSSAPLAPVETMGQEYVDRGASYYEDSWY